MTLAPPADRRLAPLGCALVAALALTLPGCGGDGAPAPDRAAAHAAQQPKTAGTTPRARASAGGCPRQVAAFVDSLDALRSRLAVGLSYEQYAAQIKRLRASYGEIPVDRLALDCLTATGTPSERALNEYIDATNAWGECLADASCTTATIEPVLQRKWRVASHFLSEAQ
jgi:hypothetical protein